MKLDQKTIDLIISSGFQYTQLAVLAFEDDFKEQNISDQPKINAMFLAYVVGMMQVMDGNSFFNRNFKNDQA